MCMPHGSTPLNIGSNLKKKKEKKHIKKVSQDKFEKGDPDFIDERTSTYAPKEEHSIFTLISKSMGL